METELRKVPSELARRKKAWVLWAELHWGLHYTCAILGVVSSCIAATSWSYARVAAIFSAACFGILGFMRPFKTCHYFLAASRILDNALLRYTHNLCEIEEVIQAVAEGEKLIQQGEEEEIKQMKSQTDAQPVAPADRSHTGASHPSSPGS
jgi:hypothetical protein